MWSTWVRQAPLLVRPLTDAERAAVAAGLRSANAYTLRRSQISAASQRGDHIPRIARRLRCDAPTARNAIHAFNRDGVAALAKRASAVHTAQTAFTPAAAARLRALLHRRPRDVGHHTSLWTLDLAAADAARQGLTATEVSGETVRATLVRRGVRWLRATTGITRPDPAYARKTGGATG
jgi:transposase